MICPVCHHTNIKEGAEECPKCNTPLTGDNLILALQKSNRDQRNQKIAMTFAMVFVVLLSAAYLYLIATDDGSPKAGEGEVVVPSDSLRNLGYTLDEKSKNIEELNTQIESMQAELTELEAQNEGEVEIENSSSSTESSQNQNAPQASSDSPAAKSSKASNKMHIVTSGETLWSIAQTQLGDGFKSQELAALNNITDPDMIVVGETLRLR